MAAAPAAARGLTGWAVTVGATTVGWADGVTGGNTASCGSEITATEGTPAGKLAVGVTGGAGMAAGATAVTGAGSLGETDDAATGVSTITAGKAATGPTGTAAVVAGCTAATLVA